MHDPTGFNYGRTFRDSIIGDLLEEGRSTGIRSDRETEAVISPEALSKIRERGGRWAAYQNVDLSDRMIGHLRFVKYGPGCGCETAPDKYPMRESCRDFSYFLIGYVNVEKGSIEREEQEEFTPVTE